MFKPAIGIAVIALVTLLSGAAIGKGGGHGGGHGGGRRPWWRSWRRPPAFRRRRPRAFWRRHHGGGRHRDIPFVFARQFSRQSRLCRARRPELRPDPERRDRAGKCPQRDEFAVARRRLAQRPPAQQSRGARADRRRSRRWRAGTGGSGASGWWQHGNGGYGWVGPLFWPFAYHDIYDYAIWGDGIGFWDYGYPDIYAGMFAPYGYDDLSGYLAQRPSGRRHGGAAPLAQMCGDDSRAIAGLPIDQIAARGAADRGAIRRPRRSRQRIDRGRAEHSRGMPGADRVDGAGPACGHAAAHRGDGIGGRHRAAAAGEVLRAAQ